MTSIFVDVNDKIYIIKCLTYNNTTENYKIDREKFETWQKVVFSCPPESTIFAFIQSIFKNPPPTKIVSMYETIWRNELSLNEPNRSYFKSTWWQ